MIADSLEALRERAKKKLCPQRIISPSLTFPYCSAGSCMAWRERKLVEGNGETFAGYCGWCGLAGEPHDE